jgi:hypothetical protein
MPEDRGSTRPLMDKLGIRPGAVVSVLGVDDPDFMRLLRERTAEVSTGRARRDSDTVFYGAESRAALLRVRELKGYMKRDGALWIVRPRGSGEIGERDTMAAGLESGLVDVKVVRFSQTHSAMKFVFRLSNR